MGSDGAGRRRVRQEDQGASKLLPLGAVARCPGSAAVRRYAPQNASGKQDAVTTQRDGEWTCRDVPTKVKPSFTSCGHRWHAKREAASASAGAGGHTSQAR